MNVSPSIKGLRTQFLSLHHFKPEQAKAILQNAVDSNQPIAIFEVQERDFISLIPMILSPINVWLSTPFITPFKWDRILYTYLIPILPIFIMWDGIISVLRTYTQEELNQIILELKNHERFNWDVGITKAKPQGVSYLLGTPKS